MTMNDRGPGAVMLPAEWECTDPVILLTMPHAATDWAYMLADARHCFDQMIEAIGRWAKVFVITPDYLPTNDTWTRDYGPITVEDPDTKQFRCLDFTFNGWGMKFAANLDNCVNRRLAAKGFFAAPIANCKGMVLEGGSIESDGRGTLMVTSECLLEANRNPEMTQGEIEAKLKRLLGARKVVWIDHGYLAGDDTDSHIDTLARFAPGGGVAYVGCSDPADEHFGELVLMRDQLAAATDADGHKLTLYELPMAPTIYDPDEGGLRLPSTYANFLALPHAVVMPTYGSPELDARAAAVLEDAYRRPVVGVDCRPLIRQHGSLHCSTMQIPRAALSAELPL